MTSKERVHASLQRRKTDRVPIWMWIHPETVNMLSRLLEIPAQYVSLALEDDIKQTWVANNFAMEGIVHQNDGESHTDQWGIEWVKSGFFNQIKNYPLANATENDIMNYNFPHDKIDELLKNMEPIIPFGKEYFIGCDVSPCLFEFVCRIRNMQNAIIDLLANPILTEHLLQKSCNFAMELSKKAINKFPLDWLWTGDDVAGQYGMIMEPDLWRKMVKPCLKKIIDIGKKKNLWVAYHCCGALRDIIPDLIEIGVDVLNPIQCNCPGMNPLELKKEFGKELAFMGGIDTQELLPNGTVSQVIKATEKLLGGMTIDGGYIFAASHLVPVETPLDNLFAMYETAGISKERIYDNAAGIRKSLLIPNS